MAKPRDSSQRQQVADDIRALSGLQHVRLRPGMYLGGTDIHALHHLVYETVDNAIDEAMAGRCNLIEIVIHGDSSITISDNSDGLPVAVAAWGLSELEIELTMLVVPGRPRDHPYSVSGGMHGVGLKAVNVLSEWLIAEIRRDGYVWRQSYERGVRTSDVVKTRPMKMNESTGTSITFRPDAEIFDGFRTRFDYSYDVLSEYCRNLAYVLPGTTIVMRDQRARGSHRETKYHFADGLKGFVSDLNRDRKPLHDILSGTKTVKFSKDGQAESPVEVDFAFQYSDDTHTTERYFVNTLELPDGGTPQTGLRTALTRTINRWARTNGYTGSKKARFTGRDTLKGLTAVVSLRHPAPRFENAIKLKIFNPEVGNIVASTITAIFAQYLQKNPEGARRVLDHFQDSTS